VSIFLISLAIIFFIFSLLILRRIFFIPKAKKFTLLWLILSVLVLFFIVNYAIYLKSLIVGTHLFDLDVVFSRLLFFGSVFVLISIGIFHYVVEKYEASEKPLQEIAIEHEKEKELLRRLDISEKTYRRLFESTRDGLLILDAQNGQIIDVNPSLLAKSGYSYGELINKLVWEIDFLENILANKKAFEQLKNKGYVCCEDLSFKTKAGKELSVEFTSNVYGVDHKKVVQCSIRDISERKKTKKLVIQERDLSQRYLDVANIMLIVIGVDEKVSLINKKGCQILGYEENEIIGKNWFDTFVPERLRKEIRIVSNKILAGELAPVEYYENQIVAKNGKEKLIAWHNVDLRDASGKITAHLSSGEDITEQKRTEETLLLSEEKYRLIFEASNDILVYIDNNGKVIDFNYRATVLTGHKKEDLVGKNLGMLSHVFTAKSLALMLANFVKRKMGINIPPYEVEAKTVAGKKMLFEIDAVAIKNAQGKRLGEVAILHDITNRRQDEENRAKRNKELEELVQLKSDFTSMVSHELRTPLTAIIEGINIVFEGEAGEINTEQKEFLEIAKRNLNRLSRLINDVLDFSKLEQKKIVFDFKKRNLIEIIDQVIEVEEKIIQKKGLYLKKQYAKNIPNIKIDGDRISQVMLNLLNNAYKFTEEGGVSVFAEKDSRGKIIKIMIDNTGMKIREDIVPDLFKKYSSFGKDKNRKIGGTGLGLAISKEIIEAHGGEIWYEPMSKGNRFCFTLPIE